MPAKSKRQYRLMQMIAHNAKFAAKMHMSQKAAREYVAGQSPKGLPEKKGKGK